MLLPSALGFSPHPPVSVYGTGTYTNNSGFSRQLAQHASLLKFRSASRFGLYSGFASLTPTSACTGFSIPGSRFSPASPQFCYIRGTGISTCCPSTTSFDLALGPDLPRADQLYPGNLRYSAERILTFSLATHSGILSS